MNKSLSIFAIVTALSVILAWFVVQSRSPETVVKKQALYPELASQIQDVKQVEIKSVEHSTVLKAQGEKWVLENKGGYAANFQRIRPLVMSISELQVREAKTANPERYSRLQVEEVSSEKAKSRQVTIKDAEGKVIADLIVGKERMNKTTGTIDSLYVRKVGEEQSYLVRGEVMAAADPTDWLDNQIIDIAPDRMASISISHEGDQSVNLSRSNKDDIDYSLENIPDGFKTKSQTTIKSIAAAIQGLRFDDVNSESALGWPAESITTVFETFDGLNVTIQSAEKDEKRWVKFSYSAQAPDDADEEAQKALEEELAKLKSTTDGWVYALPKYKWDLMRQSLSNLVIEEGAETPPEQPPMPAGMMPPGMSMPEGMMMQPPM